MSAEAANGVAAAGDEVARLYDQYGAKLQRFCMGRLRSHEEAEDAVQTTFLRVYTALRKGAVPQYEAAWLYKIAHNVCLSRIESSGRRARVEAPHDLSLLEAEMAAPASRSDELIGLEEALADMPATMRQAILLREWQGLSYQEIAEALGVSVSAVESMIFRGRKFLANALEPAKRAAGAINLGWLLGPARSLLAGGRAAFTGAGAGAKLAAGAALLAAGAGGVGVGVTVGGTHHQPKPLLPAAPAAASGSGSTAAGATASEVAARSGGTSAAATHRTAGKHRAAGAHATRVAATPNAPATTPVVPPATTPTPTPTTPTADPTTPDRPPATRPAGTTTTVAVRTPTLPTATVTIPGVTTVTTPTLPVTVPTVTTPTLPTPTVTVPGVVTVTVPTVTLP